MRLLAEPSRVGPGPAPVSLAIGVFDGVHLGHEAVIRQTLADARTARGQAVVVTFDRHPNAVVAPERTPPMIYPLWRRLDVLAGLGLDATLVFTFDVEFSRQTGEEFLGNLLRGFERVVSVCVGAGFVFGYRRSGDVDLLKRLGAREGFQVHGIEPLTLEGAPISSTRVRDCIGAGDFPGASRLLGRRYGLAGEVRPGDRLGRHLGFPTANLDVTGLVLPPSGVYAAIAIAPGLRHAAAVNIGTRPTVDGESGEKRVEAHLQGFDGDLYGRRLEIEFDHRLRGEKRFPSRSALADQIREDVGAVRDWAGNKGLI